MHFQTCSGLEILRTHEISQEETWARPIIQEAIQSEYTEGRVGIEFVGWKGCEVVNGKIQSDVVINYVADESPEKTESIITGSSEIGKCKDNAPQDYLPKVRFTIRVKAPWIHAIAPKEELTRVALHEFGHLSGLKHEDSQSLSNETSESFNPKTSQIVSLYDPESIMGYHYGHDVLRKHGIPENSRGIVLSDGDLHALRCLYQYSVEEKEKICNPSHIPGLEKVLGVP